MGYDPVTAPDRQHHGPQLHQHLRKELSNIRLRGAEIFVLRYFEGLDNTEIAEHLGTSTNTVAVTRHRARTRLKDEMGEFMGGMQGPTVITPTTASLAPRRKSAPRNSMTRLPRGSSTRSGNGSASPARTIAR